MTHPDPTERLAGLRRAMTALGTDQTTPAQRATQTEADKAMAQRIHKVRPGVPLQQVFAVLEALRAAQRVGAAATPPADQTPAAEVRDDLLRTIDHPLCLTLGYQTPEELLAAYDATRTTDRDGLRDRIRRAICEAEGFAWDSDMLEPDEYGDVADAVLAVLPAPADRAAVLTDAERQFLTFALDLAAGRMAERPDEFGADDDAAMARLRGLAGEAQQDEAGASTAEKAEALGMTPTEYRDESHRLSEQKIREAAQWLRADVAFRVLDALDGTQQQPARGAQQDERCTRCAHPKRDHDGRADHREKYSPLVAGEPWCHACNAECDYTREAQQGAAPDGEHTALHRAHVALAAQAGRDQAALARVRAAIHIADEVDVTDWQRGYRACAVRAAQALDEDGVQPS